MQAFHSILSRGHPGPRPIQNDAKIMDYVRIRNARRGSISAEVIRVQAPAVKELLNRPSASQTNDAQASELRAAIGKNILFSSLDEQQMQHVLKTFKLRTYSADETVIRQGEAGDLFFVVREGSLRVHLSQGYAEVAMGPVVMRYSDGDSFGELALMYNQPRAASVIAETACQLWALDRVTFRSILQLMNSVSE